jgi:hypothetical protein
VEALGAAHKALDSVIEALDTARIVRLAQMDFWKACWSTIGTAIMLCEVSLRRASLQL